MGKTTTAVSLAEAFAGLRPVRLLDLDNAQGSAADWYEEAQENGSPTRITDVRRADRLTDELPTDLAPDAGVVIDTPNEPAAAEGAIRAADLVIVPTTPGLLDVGRIRPDPRSDRRDERPGLRPPTSGCVSTSRSSCTGCW